VSSAQPLTVAERLARRGGSTSGMTARQHRTYMRAVHREQLQILGELPRPKASPSRRSVKREPEPAGAMAGTSSLATSLGVECEPATCPLHHRSPRRHAVERGTAILADSLARVVSDLT
jgi:hypothetical protein